MSRAYKVPPSYWFDSAKYVPTTRFLIDMIVSLAAGDEDEPTEGPKGLASLPGGGVVTTDKSLEDFLNSLE
jgi:hypothetical protein